jgi:hypothetical protein
MNYLSPGIIMCSLFIPNGSCSNWLVNYLKPEHRRCVGQLICPPYRIRRFSIDFVKIAPGKSGLVLRIQLQVFEKEKAKREIIDVGFKSCIRFYSGTVRIITVMEFTHIILKLHVRTIGKLNS